MSKETLVWKRRGNSILSQKYAGYTSSTYRNERRLKVKSKNERNTQPGYRDSINEHPSCLAKRTEIESRKFSLIRGQSNKARSITDSRTSAFRDFQTPKRITLRSETRKKLNFIACLLDIKLTMRLVTSPERGVRCSD